MIGDRKCIFILLAAGRGSRMKSEVAKQYMPLGDKPVLWYSLKAVEDFEGIDRCVLVTSAEDMEYVRKELIEPCAFTKVSRIVPGGAQRYDSVYQALTAVKEELEEKDLVLIHDGARPFLTGEILSRCCEGALRYQACTAGMPVKDTIKLADEKGFALETPDRRYLWQIQTPQAFQAGVIVAAYEKLMQRMAKPEQGQPVITDDAMVVETFTEIPVKLVEGSYTNLKITTPEDLPVAEAILRV